MSHDLRCDGTKESFPAEDKIRLATKLYLRSYAPTLIATLEPASGLTHLCLIDCGLTDIEPRLLPSTLQQLWLSDNQLQVLPQALSNLKQLSYLNLDRNRITTLPDLRPLPLRWLRLNENQLTQWPQLPNSIERLYLAHNRITSIATKPTNLQEADLSYNPITQLPDDFGAGLIRLDLAYTQLKALPQDLSAWQTLRFLNLAGCPLSNKEKDRLQKSFPSTTTLLF